MYRVVKGVCYGCVMQCFLFEGNGRYGKREERKDGGYESQERERHKCFFLDKWENFAKYETHVGTLRMGRSIFRR